MTGYSGTPLAKKLGVGPESRLCVLGNDAPWLVAELPHEVKVSRRLPAKNAQVVVLFCKDSASLRRRIRAAGAAIRPDGALWVAWPRKAAGHHSDLDENGIRSACLPTGLVDVKVAALSEDWSGLKVVWRKEFRR
jgi:Protein of unknown function (DUF3052)